MSAAGATAAAATAVSAPRHRSIAMRAALALLWALWRCGLERSSAMCAALAGGQRAPTGAEIEVSSGRWRCSALTATLITNETLPLNCPREMGMPSMLTMFANELYSDCGTR